jgi:Spy/CpxP family protein refolding chaperone
VKKVWQKTGGRVGVRRRWPIHVFVTLLARPCHWRLVQSIKGTWNRWNPVTLEEEIMTTRFRSFTVMAILTAVLAAGALYAQGPGPGRRGPGGFGGPGAFGRGGPGAGLPLRQLGLNETQQQQIRDVTEQYRERNRAAVEQLQAAMDAQREAVETMPVNEGLIRSTTQALVEAQTELAIQQARMQSEIFTLLTADQQEQARTLLADRRARMEELRERRQQRNGQPQQ